QSATNRYTHSQNALASMRLADPPVDGGELATRPAQDAPVVLAIDHQESLDKGASLAEEIVEALTLAAFTQLIVVSDDVLDVEGLAQGLLDQALTVALIAGHKVGAVLDGELPEQRRLVDQFAWAVVDLDRFLRVEVN